MGNRKRILVTLFLLLPAVMQAFPLFYLVCVSFKIGGEVIQYPPRLFPQALNFANFHEAMATAPLWRFLLNSFLVSTGITMLQIFTSILSAYALARLEFAGKKIVFGLILATMMIPGEVTIIPNYFTLARLDWLNSYQGLILPFSASGFGIFFAVPIF